MNILYMPFAEMLAVREGAGGLFDFNATLPLMALQFILLTTALTFLFYKPVAKTLEERETYISTNLTNAAEKLVKADELYQQYDEQLKAARVNAQSIISESEKEAKVMIESELSEARADAAKLIDQTNKELEAQKSIAIKNLETQVDDLSRLIKDKLLGKEVVL